MCHEDGRFQTTRVGVDSNSPPVGVFVDTDVDSNDQEEGSSSDFLATELAFNLGCVLRAVDSPVTADRGVSGEPPVTPREPTWERAHHSWVLGCTSPNLA